MKTVFVGPRENVCFRQQPPRPANRWGKAGARGSRAAGKLGSNHRVPLPIQSELISHLNLPEIGTRGDSTVCQEPPRAAKPERKGTHR